MLDQDHPVLGKLVGQAFLPLCVCVCVDTLHMCTPARIFGDFNSARQKICLAFLLLFECVLSFVRTDRAKEMLRCNHK